MEQQTDIWHIHRIGFDMAANWTAFTKKIVDNKFSLESLNNLTENSQYIHELLNKYFGGTSIPDMQYQTAHCVSEVNSTFDWPNTKLTIYFFCRAWLVSTPGTQSNEKEGIKKTLNTSTYTDIANFCVDSNYYTLSAIIYSTGNTISFHFVGDTGGQPSVEVAIRMIAVNTDIATLLQYDCDNYPILDSSNCNYENIFSLPMTDAEILTKNNFIIQCNHINEIYNNYSITKYMIDNNKVWNISKTETASSDTDLWKLPFYAQGLLCYVNVDGTFSQLSKKIFFPTNTIGTQSFVLDSTNQINLRLTITEKSAPNLVEKYYQYNLQNQDTSDHDVDLILFLFPTISISRFFQYMIGASYDFFVDRDNIFTGDIQNLYRNGIIDFFSLNNEIGWATKITDLALNTDYYVYIDDPLYGRTKNGSFSNYALHLSIFDNNILLSPGLFVGSYYQKNFSESGGGGYLSVIFYSQQGRYVVKVRREGSSIPTKTFWIKGNFIRW